MTISVAIAAYRGEKFIGEELQSISDQQIVPDEVVICDDSPDDLTEKEVRKFEKILNIRYFRNPVQLGVAANFNKALALCSGDIVFLADQDDVWYPYKTVKCLEYFEKGANVFLLLPLPPIQQKNRRDSGRFFNFFRLFFPDFSGRTQHL